jgi:hypothetical protein
MPVPLPPERLLRLARQRFEDATGRRWSEAGPTERGEWLVRIEATLRAEHGIAVDAVWCNGSWIPAPRTPRLRSTQDGDV